MIQIWTRYRDEMEKLATLPPHVHPSKKHLHQAFKPTGSKRKAAVKAYKKTTKPRNNPEL